MGNIHSEKIDQARLHAIVKGRVQGVGFRFFTMQTAYELNLTGWVRNRINGDVEVLAEGKKTNLIALLSALKRGPSSAAVREVLPDWEEFSGEFMQFRARETA